MFKALDSEITKKNIRNLVVSFYTKVLADETVGSFFIEKLGTELTSEAWAEHIDILTNFWAGIYLGDTEYRGAPFVPHMQLEGLKRTTFEQWLKLFFKTLDSIYIPEIADQFKSRATLIAGNFMRNLGL